jgi:hypothetical protein
MEATLLPAYLVTVDKVVIVGSVAFEPRLLAPGKLMS